jgi:hypothetical protein
MRHSLPFDRRRNGLLVLGSAIALAGASPLAAQHDEHAEHRGGAPMAMGAEDARYVASPVAEGQRYFMATDGVGAFIGPGRQTGDPGPLAALAREAVLEGHERVGVQLIDGSTPMQHWSEGGGDDSRNLAKVALRAGGIDILTLSPRSTVPEQGIDLFADLMLETNPEGRLLVQSSWSTDEDLDQADIEAIQERIDRLHAAGGYLDRLRTQLAGINDRAGRDLAFVVPAADAVYRLRQEVLRGNVPGIERQSELFLGGTSDPDTPIVNLVTYVWFVSMYRQPAAGLTALVALDDPTSVARERLLQEIAWETVSAEPMSGLMVQGLWLGRTRMHAHRRGASMGN